MGDLLRRLADDARGTVPHDRLADDARGTALRSRHADDARGGVPPLQRLGALRGRSPRFACPVRPLGRLPLGGVYIGVGLWLGFRGNAPIPWGREYGWLGAGFPSQASLPQSGVPLFYTLKTGGVSAPALQIRHPNTPHSTRQCRARGNKPSRKVPVFSVSHHGRRRQRRREYETFRARRPSGRFIEAPMPVPSGRNRSGRSFRW